MNRAIIAWARVVGWAVLCALVAPVWPVGIVLAGVLSLYGRLVRGLYQACRYPWWRLRIAVRLARASAPDERAKAERHAGFGRVLRRGRR